MARGPPRELGRLVGSPVTVGDDEYKVTRYRGSGKRGHVFRAERQDGRERALKFVPLTKLRRGWEQEVVKAHQLEQQPNTVRFYHLFLYGGKYAVMVFDYVEGDSLRELIETGTLTVPQVERILGDLLFFRRDCLRMGVRHGDLHPGNIILRQPCLGGPREYEVLITDFGIGYTGAVLTPKDDLAQVGLIATAMLQSIAREGLDHIDRIAYDDLCRGPAAKMFRELSPLERGDEEVAIGHLLGELDDIRGRAYATEKVSGLRPSFGDYLAGEQLGSRWKEWGDLFVAGFPGFHDVVSRNVTVLTGTRGCGKTVVFRRLSALLTFEVGPVDPRVPASFVGFYLNMNDVADAFLFGQRDTPNADMAKRIVQFFHLSLLSEVTRVAGVAMRKAPDGREKEACRNGIRWLFELIAGQVGPRLLYPGPDLAARTLLSVIERVKDEVRGSEKPSIQMASLAETDWLKRLVPGLQRSMPWIGEKPVYFLVDDYSLPRVNKAIQTVLNSVLFQRSDTFFFKIATESPSTFSRIDYSGKVLQDPDDFELTDLCCVTIDSSDEERERFLEEVFRRRFAREDRLRGKTLADILGEFEKSWAELAREIRQEPAGEDGSSGPSSPRTGRVLYYGRKVFLSMWSGDTRAMLRIALNLLEQPPAHPPSPFPIERALQDKVFRRTGGEFLHLLEACTRTSQRDGASLPLHITSWGKHLVKIAEGFKEIALHELRTRQGGREGRAEPKQAFRIEITDQFELIGIEKEVYEDLVRYGVFLRDDRGKSIRGAIIPRLYLRRLLIPFCTLTFSKVDNIPMNSGGFRRLLMDPEQFAKSWKKDRSQFTGSQGELFG